MFQPPQTLASTHAKRPPQSGFVLTAIRNVEAPVLNFHLGRGVMQKVWHIADESTFKKEVAALPDNGGSWVYRANEPGKKALFLPTDPKKSLDYYYQIRSNMAHRGKAEYGDFYRVHKALSELLPIFRKMLDDAFKPHPTWQ